ncbi:MAG: hypothetical protein Kow0042_27900 [Calditrichia bacterium]
MSEAKRDTPTIVINIFAGLGMGLLVGIIIGLSVSPVVKVILGALASLLAAFLGLQPEKKGAAVSADSSPGVLSKMQQNSLKAGSFGFACVLAIFLGLFIRTHNLFEPSLDTQLTKWEKAGYDLDYARQLIVLEKFGIDPETKVIAFGDMQKGKTSSLFSKKNKDKKDLCFELDPERFNGVTEILKAYRRQEFDGLKNLADVVEQMDIAEEDKLTIVTAISEAICEQQP